MSKLPIVSGRQAIKVLEEFEFRVDRIKGSHSVMVKDGHPALVTVPFAQRTKRGTLRGIIRDAGITVDEFAAKLRQ